MVLLVSCLDLQDLTFLLSLALRQIGLPQPFARHLLVKYPLALVHHEESSAPMHRNVWMGLHCRSTSLQEQTSFARRYPYRAVGGKNCSPEFSLRQLLHTHFFSRFLLFLFLLPEARDQGSKRGGQPLLWFRQVLGGVVICNRRRACCNGKA